MTLIIYMVLDKGCCVCLVAQSCPILCNPMDDSLPGSSVHGDSARKNTGMGCHAHLQGTLPNPGTELRSPSLQEDSLPSEPSGKSSVQFSCSVVSDSLWPHRLQHASLTCPPPPWSLLKLMSIGQWCYPTISSSVIPFFSHYQSFPALGSFPVGQLFASGGQSIGVSASASVLPVNIQDWFPLGWPCLISLQSKGLSWVFSNTTVQKHQFFGPQLSL